MNKNKPQSGIPKITPAFKKRILKDWQARMTNLMPDGPLSLGRRVGPLLISVGFDIGSPRKHYQPGVCVNNLSFPKEWLSCILKKMLYPGLISVRAHEEGKYIEAAERMKQQSPLPLEGPISLNMVIDAYKKYVEKEGSSVISELQDPALIAAWAGKLEQAKELLEWGYKDFATWPASSHEKRGGLECWYKDMQERISNPEKLRKIAEEQAVFHKVDHIPMEELIVD